jgi:hypothetical protein
MPILGLRLRFQTHILLIHQALIQPLGGQRRLAQRLPRRQLARRPGTNGATVAVLQRLVLPRLPLVLSVDRSDSS